MDIIKLKALRDSYYQQMIDAKERGYELDCLIAKAIYSQLCADYCDLKNSLSIASRGID